MGWDGGGAKVRTFTPRPVSVTATKKESSFFDLSPLRLAKTLIFRTGAFVAALAQ